METLGRSKSKIFIDVSDTSTPSWAQIDKSTVFELAMNPVTETYSFIDNDNDVTETERYAPSLEQEIRTIEGNTIFDFMHDLFYNMPTGEDAKRNCLLVFPKNIGTSDSPKFEAWKSYCSLALNTLSSTDKKLTWTINFGAIEKGSVTITSGTPSFTKA